jgi:hypothetical protein
VLRDLRFQLPFEKYVENIRKLDVRIQEVSLLYLKLGFRKSVLSEMVTKA